MNYPNSQIQVPAFYQSLLIAVLMLGMLPFSAVAQSSESSQKDRFISIKDQLQSAVDSLDKAGIIKAKYALQPYADGNENPLKKLAYYYMGYADYRLNTQSPGINEDQKEKILDEAVQYLEHAVALDPDFADARALLGSAYGKKAAGFFSGMKYGPKADDAMEKAMESGPENPRVYMLNAIGLLYKPSMFGGSTEGAINGFKKAAELFKTFQPKNELMPDWGRAEVYAWLGQAYEQNEEYAKAKTAYGQALEVDPGYGWVKYKLLPELAEKVK